MDKTQILSEYISKKFVAQKVEFYHAENLQNFTTYCKSKALLCRDLLFQQCLNGYTRFYSDPKDHEQGVHTRVFGNLTDFGWIFATYKGGVTPNIYGPISLCFDSAIYKVMEDIAITKQTVTKLPKNWRQSNDVVFEKATVDEICSGCLSASSCPIIETWHTCELSSKNQSISLHYLKYVTVEPIIIDDTPLIETVKTILAENDINKPVFERQYASVVNKKILDDIVNYCIRCARDRNTKLDTRDLPDSVSSLSPTMIKRILLWCNYFIFGTVHEFEREQAWDPDQSTCEVCGPSSDDPPALIDWSRLVRYGYNTALDYGFCTWCNTLSLRCAKCELIYPMPEWNYNKEFSCICGLMFSIQLGSSERGEISFENIIIHSK